MMEPVKLCKRGHERTLGNTDSKGRCKICRNITETEIRRKKGVRDRSLIPRKTHCKNGHELTPDNVTSNRGCKRCAADRMIIRYHKNPEHHKKRNKDWKLKNDKRVKEYSKIKYEQNAAKNRAYAAKYRSEHYGYYSDLNHKRRESISKGYAAIIANKPVSELSDTEYSIIKQRIETFRAIKNSKLLGVERPPITYCPKGHLKTASNTNKIGACRICSRDSQVKYAKANKAIILLKECEKRLFLSDSYLSRLVKRGMNQFNLTPEILEIKKLTLQLKRSLKNVN